MAIGLVALLGTGILAAVDRSDKRAASLHIDANRMQRRADVAPAGPALVQGPAVDNAKASIPAPLPTRPAATQAVTAASNGEITPAPRPAEAAFMSSASAAPAATPTPPSIAFAEPRPQPAEGPVVTASLAQPAPPARPSISAPEAATRAPIKTDASASTDCLPGALRAVLADVAVRFGEVAVVSTHQLNTGNHSAGSIREKLHHDCRAIDFRPDRSRIEEVKAYLRTRPEIGGVESYRNGVVHMDVSGAAVAVARRAAQAQASAQDVPAAAPPSAPAPQTTPAPSLFTPAVNERYR